MAFALKRAALEPDKYRRIIVVILFLSIIEQNAEVYSKIFGSQATLEHHSGSVSRLNVKEDHFAPLADQLGPRGESILHLQARLSPLVLLHREAFG